MKKPEEIAKECKYDIESFCAGFNEATRWRSVEYELPKDYREVLIKGFWGNRTHSQIDIGRYSKDQSGWVTSFRKVTHWRYIYND